MVKKKITESVKSDDAKSKRWKTLFAAGRMAYETGELRQAETLLARAMELAKDMPERIFAVNATTIGSAAILLAGNRWKEAETRLRKSIAALEGYPEPEHQELLAVAMRFHGQALIEKGDIREAESELKKSATILGELGADAGVQMAYSLCDLCGLYLSQGRVSEAESYIYEAMHILETMLGTEAPEYVRASMIYKLTLPMEDSDMLDSASDGVQVMQYFYGANHPNVARALGRYLDALNKRGDTARLEEAKQRFNLKKLIKK